MDFATYYNRDSWHEDAGTEFKEESLTDQSFRLDADINNLLLRHNVATTRTPVYDMNNYYTAHYTSEDWQNQKARVQRKWLDLTEEEKLKFKSPQAFLRYCVDPKNWENAEHQAKSDTVPPSTETTTTE